LPLQEVHIATFESCANYPYSSKLFATLLKILITTVTSWQETADSLLRIREINRSRQQNVDRIEKGRDTFLKPGKVVSTVQYLINEIL